MAEHSDEPSICLIDTWARGHVPVRAKKPSASSLRKPSGARSETASNLGSEDGDRYACASICMYTLACTFDIDILESVADVLSAVSVDDLVPKPSTETQPIRNTVRSGHLTCI